MERIIILARHARAEKGEQGQPDRERKLTDVGREEIHRKILALKGLGIEPELILASNAARALETAELLTKGFNLSDEVLVPEPVLYGASPFEIVSLIRSVNDKLNCILVCGHNPDISETGIFLTGDMAINLNTAGILILSYGGSSWNSLIPGSCAKRTIL